VAGPYGAPGVREPKQKLVAGLLGILLGSLGIHRFYLGYNGIGTVQLVLGLLGIFTCGITTIASGIWGIIDGVMILTGSIATDAQGVPLRD
jgi:TM2 domain-containing membrane protein YozV